MVHTKGCLPVCTRIPKKLIHSGLWVNKLTHSHFWVCVYVCTVQGPEDNRGYHSSTTNTASIFWSGVSHRATELIKWTALAGQWAPWTHLSLPPQYAPWHPAFSCRFLRDLFAWKGSSLMTELSHQLQNITAPVNRHWFSLDQTSEPLFPGNNVVALSREWGHDLCWLRNQQIILQSLFLISNPLYPYNPGYFTPDILIWSIATQLVYGRQSKWKNLENEGVKCFKTFDNLCLISYFQH